MRGFTIMALGGALALAACGGAKTDGNASNAASPANETATSAQSAAGNQTAGIAAGDRIAREPGSWNSQIRIVKLEGKDVEPDTRRQVQGMFDAIGAMSVCMTPEAIAKEDIGANLEAQSGGRNCDFTRREVAGPRIEIAAQCIKDGEKMRMTASGTASARAQDITMRVEPLDAAGNPEGVMEMQVTSRHNGPCKPGDLRPDAEPSDAAGQ